MATNRSVRRAQQKRPLTTAEKIQAAKLPQQTVEIPLRGDLAVQWEAAERKLGEAMQAPDNGDMAGPEYDVEALARAVEDIRQEMIRYSISVVLQALPPEQWIALKEAHPPRRDEEGGVHPDDRNFGVNQETFFPAAIPLSTVEPADMTAELWADLFNGKLSAGTITNLFASVWLLNRSTVQIPFSPAASKILSLSGK